MIKLTMASGQDAWVNPSTVNVVMVNPDSSVLRLTLIGFSGPHGASLLVKESVEDVVRAIQDAR